MQIVIDIDDVDYEYIKNGCIVPIKYDNHIYNAIRKGTQLPKGHGRLIDADALNRKNVNCANVPMNFIDTAPTIIEADKAESENKE